MQNLQQMEDSRSEIIRLAHKSSHQLRNSLWECRFYLLNTRWWCFCV